MPVIDPQRPAKLYRYSTHQWLQRSLTLGEFRLRPPVGSTIGAANNFLILSLSQRWDEKLFTQFGDADSCLIIHNTEEFGERIHRAVQKVLPSWAGIDAAVSYGAQSPLGSVFSKPRNEVAHQEWMFAWRPMQSALSLNPIFIQIGSIESIAEIRHKQEIDTLLH